MLTLNGKTYIENKAYFFKLYRIFCLSKNKIKLCHIFKHYILWGKIQKQKRTQYTCRLNTYP